MNLQLALMAVLAVFLGVFLVMLWVIYNGMKRFLSDNIEEALVVSGEYIGERIMDLQTSTTQRMNALHSENKTLREEIIRRLQEMTAIITESNDKAELGANSIVKELQYIIPTLRDEMTKLLDTLSKNAASFQTTTIKNFEAEIQKFIKAIDTSCKELNKAADDQSKLIANIAGTVQGVMTDSGKDLQSTFTKTHAELQKMISDAVGRINADYQENMKKMFQAMADNLAAITQQLRTAGAVPETPAPAKKSKTKKAKADEAVKEEASNPEITQQSITAETVPDSVPAPQTPAKKTKTKKAKIVPDTPADDAKGEANNAA